MGFSNGPLRGASQMVCYVRIFSLLIWASQMGFSNVVYQTCFSDRLLRQASYTGFLDKLLRLASQMEPLSQASQMGFPGRLLRWASHTDFSDGLF